ncbi:type II toxin-antitoxin system RelE/ParE family toxin [Wolbachia endosymbiont (group A) of Clivina fossor]|uniref:type II toxin-antitoxin system RelE family toxin n=1 Tax=Wolbachia endosymbiont (group A) of Clivina fossor TaxID=3066133 RepID=UPI0031331F53
MKTSGNKPYTIKYLKRVREEDIPSLPENIKTGIKKAIRERLTVDPIKLGEPLHHSLKGHKRLRVSNYRIIYRVNTVEHKVTIVAIGHRDTIYEKARKILSRH